MDGGKRGIGQAGRGVAFTEAPAGKLPVGEQLSRGDMEVGARRFVETLVIGPGAWEQLPPRLQQIFVQNAPTWLDEVRDTDVFEIDPEAPSSSVGEG
jgi:hypothetical protein